MNTAGRRACQRGQRTDARATRGERAGRYRAGGVADFTRWLEHNVDALNDVLDFPLVDVERERSAGVFSVDLVAEDESGAHRGDGEPTREE